MNMMIPVRPLDCKAFYSPSTITKRVFSTRCSIIVTPKKHFEFYQTEAYGRSPARNGCNVSNWSTEFKQHVYHVIGMTPTGKYAVITVDELMHRELFIELFDDWKDAKAAVVSFYKGK